MLLLSMFGPKRREKNQPWEQAKDLCASPINSRDIPNFKKWVLYSGYKPEVDHLALDFATYIGRDGRCYIGLPSNTQVRAIRSGEVVGLTIPREIPYYHSITILHDDVSSPVESLYAHTTPLPEILPGIKVKKGQVIGTLAHQTSYRGTEFENLIHLHLELKQSGKKINPLEILFPDNSWVPFEPFRDTAIINQPRFDEFAARNPHEIHREIKEARLAGKLQTIYEH